MNRESNTGVLPPEGEESANFESVNAGANAGVNNAEPVLESVEGSNGNTPLGNAPESAVEVPATALNAEPNTVANVTNAAPEPEPTATVAPTATKAKKPQSAKQLGTIAAQAQERASLKSAGVAKPSVAMVATLASMRSKGDAKYNTAFANAVAGKPLNSYRTAKTQKKSKKNATVTNSTAGPDGVFSRNAMNGVNTSKRKTAKNKKAKGVNSGTQSYSKGTAAASQTFMRNRNIVNSNALNSKIDAVLDMADSIGKQMGEMKRVIKTLKAKRPSAARTSRSKNMGRKNTVGSNSLLGLPPIPPVPTDFNMDLSTIQEGNENNNGNNGFTPPP